MANLKSSHYLSDTNTAHKSLRNRFRVFSAVLFLFVLTAGSFAFMGASNSNSISNIKQDVTYASETSKLRLADVVNTELLLVIQLVNTPVIQNYFLHPENPEYEKAAIEEFNAYKGLYDENKEAFWINDIDKLFYSSNADPYYVDPTLPVNYWYNMTLYNTDVYNFNVNYNPDIDKIALWINAPVFDRTSFSASLKPIGMLGTGIDLSEFTGQLYSEFDPNLKVYIFNNLGEVTISRDLEAVSLKKHITEMIDGEPGRRIYSHIEHVEQENEERHLFITDNTVYLCDYIPSLDWYIATVYPITLSSIYGNGMTIVFVTMLAVILIVMVLSNIYLSFIGKALDKQNEELIAANIAVHAANVEKSHFLAKMSHEIRTPMNAIIGMSELIAREEISGAARDYLEKLKRSGNGLLSIINDILDFSKIESGKLELNCEKFKTENLINDVTSIIDIRADSKGLKFEISIDENLPKILIGDESRIRQVFINLLTNAVKYTPQGTVSFKVYSGLPDDRNQMMLYCEVKDTGIGIKSDDIPRLFGTFTQFDSKKNAGIEGTGLGLAISKQLCLAMNGDVTVMSEYGAGSTFTASLKVKIADEQNLPDLNENSTSKDEFSASHAKVLVVDDLDINLEIASGLMTIFDITADTALSGHEAIHLCVQNQYDIIFMDHMMPDMDGIETASKIRKLGSYEDTPIVALTANAVSGMKEMFIQNGFTDFMSKPIDVNMLKQILEKWI
ncbi:MAG: response regulator [Ruminococcus sp.]|jgi:signal transduction histidine kinase|nr:response regulator [Ruminococcus sp.]